MTALTTALADYRARQARLLAPLSAPRLAAVLVAAACHWAALPLAVATAAVAGYREAQSAVLTPGIEG